uniref:RxLR effector candidate protein n=1 Tax=Hyaloperonospora arabidopsidis (strain Emoy2) TaxID=559515 RepID=M4BT79_HYAAE
MSPRNSSDDEHVTAVQRVATASIARRRNAQLAAQTPPAGSSDNSGEGMRPELALVMEQQATIVARLEELERERMILPSPTATSFGPASSMESRVIVPATRPAATFRSPSMRMTHQQHYLNFAAAREGLQAAAEARDMQQAEERAAIVAAQGQLQQRQGEAQARELAHFQARLQAERAALAKEHEEQKRAVQEREQSLYKHKQEVLNERNFQRQQEAELDEQVRVAAQAHRASELALKKEAMQVEEEQRAREARLNEEAIRIKQEHENAGSAWQHARSKAAKAEDRVREAEERGYARAVSEAAAREASMRDAASQEAANRAVEQARMQQTSANAPTRGAHVGGLTRVPLAKDSKLDIRVFTGKELHKGLGGGFKHWKRAFKEELEMAQEACGYA